MGEYGDLAVKNGLISSQELEFLRKLNNLEQTIDSEQREVYENLKFINQNEKLEGSKLKLFHELKELYDQQFIDERAE